MRMRSVIGLTAVAVGLLVSAAGSAVALATSSAADRGDSRSSVASAFVGNTHSGGFLARKFLHARRGGVVRAGRAVSLRVPPRVMKLSGWATISQISVGEYDVHIWAPWKGYVIVTIHPPRQLRVAHNAITHRVNGAWRLESSHLGQLRVSVNRLSRLTTITKLITRSGWAKCAALIGVLIPGVDVAAADAAIACLEQAGQTLVTGRIANLLARALNLPDCDAHSYLQLITKTCTAAAPTLNGGGTGGGTPPPSPPPPPSAGGTIITNPGDSPCLDFHNGPGHAYTVIDCIPDGTTISIDCIAQGNAVTGPYGTETIWDHTSYRDRTGYVTDAYVYTGTNNAVAPPC